MTTKACKCVSVSVFAHLDDVHVGCRGGLGGRGGGAEGGDSQGGAHLSDGEAVEVVVHRLLKEVVGALVTGALVHSSPGDGKEWSVVPGLAGKWRRPRLGQAQDWLLPDQS